MKRILVFPAASRPSMRILISLLPKILESSLPILAGVWRGSAGGECGDAPARGSYKQAGIETMKPKQKNVNLQQQCSSSLSFSKQACCYLITQPWASIVKRAARACLLSARELIHYTLGCLTIITLRLSNIMRSRILPCITWNVHSLSNSGSVPELRDVIRGRGL
jgi:hypothetical protein